VGSITPLVPPAFEGLVNILAGLHLTENESVCRLINNGDSIQNILRILYQESCDIDGLDELGIV
jgi:hypothetical protein